MAAPSLRALLFLVSRPDQEEGTEISSSHLNIPAETDLSVVISRSQKIGKTMNPTTHQDNFPCTKCAEHFDNRQDQAFHLVSIHQVQEPWLCYVCPASFVDQDALKAHRHPSDYHECGHRNCRRHFPSTDMLDRHLKHDHKEQLGKAKRSCLTCGFENESHIAISLHNLQEHSLQCKRCPQKLTKQVDLLVHNKKCGILAESTQRPAHEESLMLNDVPTTIAPHQLHEFPDTRDPEPAQHLDIAERDASQSLGAALNVPQSFSFAQAANLPGFTFTAQPLPALPATAPPRRSLPPLPSDLSTLYPGCQLTPQDFDPKTVYESSRSNKNAYKMVPEFSAVDGRLQIADAHLFNADPKLLAYGNMLRLACKYTPQQILARVNNKNRPARVFKNYQAVESRIKAAIKHAADSQGESLEDVRGWLKAERAKNAVFIAERAKRAPKRPLEEPQDAPFMLNKRVRFESAQGDVEPVLHPQSMEQATNSVSPGSTDDVSPSTQRSDYSAEGDSSWYKHLNEQSLFTFGQDPQAGDDDGWRDV